MYRGNEITSDLTYEKTDLLVDNKRPLRRESQLSGTFHDFLNSQYLSFVFVTYTPSMHHKPSFDFCPYPSFQTEQLPSTASIFDDWLASREITNRKGVLLAPGSQRPISHANSRLACKITKECAFDLFRTLWNLNPLRTTLMMIVNIVRGLFPAFRGYSQALIINEVSALISLTIQLLSGVILSSSLSSLQATSLGLVYCA